MASDEGNSRASQPRLKPGTLLLWILVLISLLLNAILFNQLLTLKRAAQQLALDASAAVGELQGKTFAFNVPIDETIIIETDLPVQETLTVPIVTELPINTVVTVSVDAGILGTIPLRIPISTTVPVDIEVDIPLDTSFAVRAPVEVQMDVPIEVVVADEPLYDDLSQVRERLDEVAAQLGGS